MDNFPFSLDQLRILKAIATEGNFKKASQKLCISQPTISLQIQKLEKKLDVSLFERNKQQVEFTETGQLLLRYGNRILSLCEETFHGLQDLQDLRLQKFQVQTAETLICEFQEASHVQSTPEDPPSVLRAKDSPPSSHMETAVLVNN